MAELGGDLRWLITVAVLNFATQRLVFIRADLKDLLGEFEAQDLPLDVLETRIAAWIAAGGGPGE